MFWLIMVPPRAANIHGIGIAKTNNLRDAMVEIMALTVRGVSPILLIPN